MQFKREVPTRPQYNPYQPPPCKYGKESQETIPEDTTAKANTEQVKIVQQVKGSVLYYTCAVDCMVLVALSGIASKQSHVVEGTQNHQLLDYLTTRPDATVWYCVSEILLNIHLDASYLSEARARSRVTGYYFIGVVPQKGYFIRLNGTFLSYTEL